jgi:hypothetical protein
VRPSFLRARRVLLINNDSFNDAVSNSRLYIRRRWDGQGMMNLKGCWRKRSWPNLRHLRGEKPVRTVGAWRVVAYN